MTDHHPRRHESPYSRDATLSDEEERVEGLLPEPPHSAMSERPLVQYRIHPAARYFRRGPWENAAVVLIALGIVMLMQPHSMALYTWSFLTILVGTAMFVIVSHFPEEPDG
jgi:hypothetical protein